MSTDLIVYRSDASEVLDAFCVAVEARREWGKRIDAFVAEHDPTGKRHAVVSTGWHERLLGMEHLPDVPVPDGWRVERPRNGLDYLTPYRSRKEGKAAAKALDALNPAPDVRAAVPGMPTHTDLFGRPGMELREVGTALYALWSSPPNGDVDESLWERCPLSRYYAVVEAEAEATS
jgi:hypothetical protein